MPKHGLHCRHTFFMKAVGTESHIWPSEEYFFSTSTAQGILGIETHASMSQQIVAADEVLGLMLGVVGVSGGTSPPPGTTMLLNE